MTTTQNVAWPTMIVVTPKSKPIARNAVLRARPVTMPGSASGRITMNAIVSRPKNRKRATARASSDPSTIARIVAPIATWTDVANDERMPASLNALTYQSSVNEVIGQVATLAALNEYRTMMPIGR